MAAIILATIHFCGTAYQQPGEINLASIDFGSAVRGNGCDYNIDFNQDFRAPLPEE